MTTATIGPGSANPFLHTLSVEVYDETTRHFTTRAAFAGDRGDRPGSAKDQALTWLTEQGIAYPDGKVRLIPWDYFTDHDITTWRNRWSPDPAGVARLVVEFDTTGWSREAIATLCKTIAEDRLCPMSFREVTRAEADRAPKDAELPPVPDGRRRLVLHVTAEAQIDETWTLDVTPAAVGAALEDHDGDIEGAARELLWQDNDAVTTVHMSDEVVGDERERRVYRVEGWPGEPESLDLTA